VIALLDAAAHGIQIGLLYALVAYGFALVFTTTGVLNLAHGQMFVLGGVGAWLLVDEAGLPVLVALPLVLVAVGVVGIGEYLVAVRPVQRIAGSLGWVVSTLGFSLMLGWAAVWLLGGRARPVAPFLAPDVVVVGGITVSTSLLAAATVSLVVAVALRLVYRRTRIGLGWTAVAADAETARLRGVDSTVAIVSAFAVGSMLAALGGFLAAPLTFANPDAGFPILIKAFVIAVAGGLANPLLMACAGMVIGVLEDVAAAVLGHEYSEIVVVVVILALLLIRPRGVQRALRVA
jgi:branched-chain amino acid transport system permease protein